MTRALVRARGLDVQVSSAGTSATDGSPASDGAILVGLERSLDLSAHRARALTGELVAAADLVLCMGVHHAERARALGGASRTFLLHDYAADATTGHSLSDPFGGDLDAYRETADELQLVLARVVERLAAGGAAAGSA